MFFSMVTIFLNINISISKFSGGVLFFNFMVFIASFFFFKLNK